MKKGRNRATVAAAAIGAIAWITTICFWAGAATAGGWVFVEAPFRYIQKSPYETYEWTIVQPGASDIRITVEQTHFRYSRPDGFEDEKSKIEIIAVSDDGNERLVNVIDWNIDENGPGIVTDEAGTDVVKIRYTAGANGGIGYWPEGEFCPEWKADTFSIQGYSYFSDARREGGDGEMNYSVVDAHDPEPIHTYRDCRAPITVKRPVGPDAVIGDNIKVDFFLADYFFGSSRGVRRGDDLYFTVQLDLEELVALGYFEFVHLRLRESTWDPGRAAIAVREQELEHTTLAEDYRQESSEAILFRGDGRPCEQRAVLELEEAGMVQVKVFWDVHDDEAPIDVDLFEVDEGGDRIAEYAHHGIQAESRGLFVEGFSRWLEAGTYYFQLNVPAGARRGTFYLRFPAGEYSWLEPLDGWEEAFEAEEPNEPVRPNVVYYRFNPRVFKQNRPRGENVILEAEIEGQPDSAVLRVRVTGEDIHLSDNGGGGDAAAGDGIYTALLPDETVAAFVREFIQDKPRYHRKKLGYLKVRHCNFREFRQVDIWAEMLSNDIPPVDVRWIANDVQYSEHLVNMVDPERMLRLQQGKEISQAFYSYFNDDYDYIHVFPAVHNNIDITSCGTYTCHYTVRTSAENIGLDARDRTEEYGSSGRLLGITPYEDPVDFDGASWLYLHEFGHSWVNFLAREFPFLSDPNRCHCHWPPLSDLRGIMAGARFAPLTHLGGNEYEMSEPVVPSAYSDLSLYLMGLLPADEVATHYLFAEEPEKIEDGDTVVLRGSATSFTVEAMIRGGDFGDFGHIDGIGERVPAFEDAQKTFRVASIIVSDELLTDDEMRIYDYFAARAEETRLVRKKYAGALDPADERTFDRPFYLATRRRGRLDTRIAEDHVRVTSISPSLIIYCPDSPPEVLGAVITVNGNGFSAEDRVEFVPHPERGAPEGSVHVDATNFINPWELEVEVTIDIPYIPWLYDLRIIDGDGDLRRDPDPEILELDHNCCLSDFIDRIFSAAGGGDGGNDDISAYRDKFMRQSVEGQQLIKSYYGYSGELITMCIKAPELAKKAALLLDAIPDDLAMMMKYGNPALSPLDPANLKLVSLGTIDEGLELITQFKKRASTDLTKELLYLEYAIQKGLEGTSLKKSSGTTSTKGIQDKGLAPSSFNDPEELTLECTP